ncbi:growth arrest-specific protein 1-like [Macrosteles quadrilineatus]|uniref:growth arrest-specific protein 1-like n=1 Tax=Macrosteles quadrilineatus TaxID=74068 RepID=UPI0023E12621|nr:growth arrest-specific protein 1-like [Macrosteles quadrilineatus]
MFLLVVAGVLLCTSAGGSEPHRKVSCEEARLKCAYRTGCGMALQNYMVGCSSVLRDSGAHCPESCQHALIALTSTDEGKDLMSCECTDELCKETKERVEVCRPHVLRATRNESIVSCRVAEWICGADGVCSTALDYYHRYCRSMFLGRKCSNRCKNSISILRRQEKAAKLTTCVCDGREEYDCEQIHINMARLCFHKEPEPPPPPVDEEPTAGVEEGGSGVMVQPRWLFVCILMLTCLLAT